MPIFQTLANTNQSVKVLFTMKKKTGMNANKQVDGMHFCSLKASKPIAKDTKKSSSGAAKQIVKNVP